MEGLTISNAEYRAMEGISSTELKKLVKSPAHYKYWKEHPTEPTPALTFGKAAHKYMLEKDDFGTEFVVAPNVDRRTKEGKAIWDKFVEDSKGKDVIPIDDFEKIKEMHKALYETPFVAKLLNGQKELSFFGVDELTGLKTKVRPDCITEVKGTHILIDYKTTENAETEAFMRSAINLNYDLQLAYYKDVLEQNTGHDYMVIFIAQEKSAPYCVNVLQADEYFLKSGRDVYRAMLEVYKECSESGNWYGYMNGSVNNLSLPSWLIKQYQ